MFEFPRDDLDTPNKAQALMGGYWAEVYEGKDQIQDLVYSRNTLWQQARDGWEDAYRSKSRLLITPVTTKNWLYFPIMQSKGSSPKDNHGGGRNYGESEFQYGVSVGYSWDLPTGVVSISQIYNRISDPSSSLIETIDFYIDNKINKIVFSKDPFSNPNFAVATVNSQDGTSDKQLAMWAFNPKIDKRSIQLIYGTPIGADGKSTDDYKKYVNGIYDSMILGMSSGKLGNMLGSALSLPVSYSDETVERVHDTTRKVIVTDKRVYFVPNGATSSVVVGDKVKEGQSLSDALVVTELKRNCDISDIKAVNLTKGFVGNGFMYDIGFVNDFVIPTVTSTSDGSTDFRFYIGGHPLDVERFWEMVNDRGAAMGLTLAEGLDKRADKIGQPEKESLPGYINPLRFLVDEMMPGGFTLVSIKVASISDGLPNLTMIPDLIPLGSGIFFIFEAPLAIDSLFDVQSNSEDKYTALETVEGYIEPYLLNSAVTLKSISSSCE